MVWVLTGALGLQGSRAKINVGLVNVGRIAVALELSLAALMAEVNKNMPITPNA